MLALTSGQHRVLKVLADRKMEDDKALDQNLLGALDAIKLCDPVDEDDAKLLRDAVEKQA